MLCTLCSYYFCSFEKTVAADPLCHFHHRNVNIHLFYCHVNGLAKCSHTPSPSPSHYVVTVVCHFENIKEIKREKIKWTLKWEGCFGEARRRRGAQRSMKRTESKHKNLMFRWNTEYAMHPNIGTHCHRLCHCSMFASCLHVRCVQIAQLCSKQ